MTPFRRQHARVEEARERGSELRIERDRLGEFRGCSLRSAHGVARQERATLQVGELRFDGRLVRRVRTGQRYALDPPPQFVRDLRGDCVLDGKQVSEPAIERRRPDLPTRVCVHQARTDAQLVTRTLRAAQHEVPCAESLADRPCVDGEIVDTKRRAARDDREPGHRRETIEHHFRNANGQVGIGR